MNEGDDSQLDSLRSQLDAMKARERISYETATLQEDIKKHVTAIVNGDCDDEVFLKNSLDHMVIYRERRIEVRLNLLCRPVLPKARPPKVSICKGSNLVFSF